MHGAVARLAEGTYARIPDGRKPLVRALMLRLVGEGEGDAPVRRRAPLAELDLERNEDVADVLATLADSRLVTVGEGSVEVAHEALLREWPRLREWIEEDAEGRRLRRHITQAATEWDAAGRDQGELYRGARLAAALDWSTDHAFELNELEREFVTESREASEQETKRARRTNRRLRALLAGVAVLLVAAVVGGVFALVQRGEARDAETAQLAQRLGAQALVEEDLDLSLLLARQAVAIDDTPQTRGYLLAALLRRAEARSGSCTARRRRARGRHAPARTGATLAVADFFGKLLFFDARTYEPNGEPLPVGGVGRERRVQPGREDPRVRRQRLRRLIDARTRKQLAETSVEGRAARIAFTSDGSKLVVHDGGRLDLHPGRGHPEAGRPPIRPEASEALLHPVVLPASPLRAHARQPLGHHGVGRGELAWWDLQSPAEDRARSRSHRAITRCAQPGRSHRRRRDRRGHPAGRRTHRQGRTATAGFAGSPNWLRFSPDGTTVVSANLDGTVTLWDAASATPLETLRGHSSAVQQLVFSPDGKTLYTVSSDGTAIAWGLTGKRSVKRPFRFTHDRDFDGAYDGHPGRFSPDGRLIAVGLKEGGIALWTRATLPRRRPPCRDGRRGQGARLLSRRTDAGRRDQQRPGDDLGRRSRALRHGPLPAAASSRAFLQPRREDARDERQAAGVQLWDVATGAPLGKLGDTVIGGDVALSADGALVALAVAGGAGPRVRRSGTSGSARGSPPWRGGRDGDRSPSPSAPTADCSRSAATARSSVWDVRTQKLVHALDPAGGGRRRSSSVQTAGSLPSPASASPSPPSGTWRRALQIGPSLTAGRRTAMIDLSSDGRRLLMTLANGEGAVWDVDPVSWARRACALANRTLTREEWERFLPGRPYEPACAT